MIAALVLFLVMHFWFFAAVIRRRNDLADIAWGLGFILLAVTQFLSSDSQSNPRSIAALTLVVLWGLRLSIYIASRSRGAPEDPRYVEMRVGWGDNWIINSYLKVFLLQSVLLFAIAQPVLMALRLTPSRFNGIDLIAVILAVVGFATEAISDIQKNAFKSRPENRGKICDVGLWCRSRHPNYFGEILFWIGMSVFSLHEAERFWWVWFSPALLIFLLLKVSGVPLIEKRYAGRPDYADYKRRTNLLLPFRLRN